MSAAEDKGTVLLVSAVMRSDGFPDFVLTQVEVTPEEYDEGVHYLLADEALTQRGYEQPYVHFAESEMPPFLLPAVQQYLGVDAPDATMATAR